MKEYIAFDLYASIRCCEFNELQLRVLYALVLCLYTILTFVSEQD